MIPDPSRRARMVAMYERGLGTGEIAAEFSVRPPAIRKALIRAGVYRGAARRGPQRNPKTNEQIDALAQHVADGGTVSAWARESGIPSSWAHQLWGKICRDLGAQAV